MALLAYSDLKTFKYQGSRKYQKKLRMNAINQFLRLLTKFREYAEPKKKSLKYGFEIEVHAIKREEKNGKENYLM